MLKKIKKIPFQIIISWGLKILLFLFVIFEVYNHNILVAAGALTALALSVTPSYFFKSYYITLPRIVEATVTFALLLHIIGLSFKLYHDPQYWWWDQVTHFFGTATIALLAFMFVFTLNYVGKIKMTTRLLAVFTFSFAMTIGALWEVGELYFDKVMGTQSLGDLYDTIEDLEFNAIGGLLVSIFGYGYIRLFMKRQHEHEIKVGEVDIEKQKAQKRT